MTATINHSELAKIPFIAAQQIGTRVLTTLTFHEDGKWHMWVPTSEGLHWLLGEPAEADYFARQPESDTDIHLKFLNFMVQHACWSDTLFKIDGIQNDIHNLGASISKIDIFTVFLKETKPKYHDTYQPN